MADLRSPDLGSSTLIDSLPPEVRAAREPLDRMAKLYQFSDKTSLYQLMAACHSLGVVRSSLNELDLIKKTVQIDLNEARQRCPTAPSNPPRFGKTSLASYLLEVEAEIAIKSRYSNARAEILALERKLSSGKEYIDEQTVTYNLMNGVNKENPQGPQIKAEEMEALRKKRMEIKYKEHGRLSDEEFSELCRIVRDWPGKIEDLDWLIKDVVDKSRVNRPPEQTEYLMPYLTLRRNAFALIRPFIGQIDDSSRKIFKLLIEAYLSRPAFNLNEELFRSFCGGVLQEGYDFYQLIELLEEVKTKNPNPEKRVGLFNAGLGGLPKGQPPKN